MRKKIILSLYEDFRKIDSIKDLNKRGLSFSDYNSLLNIINELALYFKSEFFINSIANYLKKFGVKVKLNNINFIATI